MFSRKIDLRPFGNFSQKNPFSETKIRILRLVTVRFPPPVKKSSADRRAHRLPTHGTKAQRASEGLADRRKDDGAQKILELTRKSLSQREVAASVRRTRSTITEIVGQGYGSRDCVTAAQRNGCRGHQGGYRQDSCALSYSPISVES